MNEINNIRPMTLGEILDRAIRLYRQNFLKFIGIFAIPYIPLVLLQSILSFFYTSGINRSLNDNFETQSFVNTGVLSLIGTLIVGAINFILVSGFATAALTRAVANNYTGKPVGILDSYRTLSSAGFRLVLALIVVSILIGFIGVWTFIPIRGAWVIWRLALSSFMTVK